jgi:hypothetical protein
MFAVVGREFTQKIALTYRLANESLRFRFTRTRALLGGLWWVELSHEGTGHETISIL